MENPNENLIRQNKLLEQISGLMARQNMIMQQNLQQNLPTPTREVFVNDIEHDEMRSGYLVTSHKKKLWNVQIGLINEFARICKKHNLRWFAFHGTLLGAARHKGFIPWDDDSDVVMLRPDYNKFVKIIAEEIKYPYRMDNWFDYRHEGDAPTTSEYEKTLPMITLRQTVECPLWWPLRPMMRMVDQRTTMVDFNARKHLYTGIWLDIFALDVVPPCNDKKQASNFEIAREMYLATVYPQNAKKALENNRKLLLSPTDLKKFLELSYRRRGIYLDRFMERNFVNPTYVGEMNYHCFESSSKLRVPLKAFDETVYLPLEGIEVPVPGDWEGCLKAMYGDWHKMMITHKHAAEWSVDIPYSEYCRLSAFMRQPKQEVQAP